ncbi:MAG: hypothetical protein ACOX8I_04105 [Bacillota bacterium]
MLLLQFSTLADVIKAYFTCRFMICQGFFSSFTVVGEGSADLAAKKAFSR